MLNPRILMVLLDTPDAGTALDMMLEALACAKKPFGVRFAIPSRLRADVAANQPTGAIREEELKFYDDSAGLATLPRLVVDETHFLLLRGSFAFAERWDEIILNRFGKIVEPRALMSAVITGEGEAAQACLPAFSGAIGEDGAHLCAGLPLVCSAAPVKTLLAYPTLLFGPTPFLREADPSLESLSILATAAGYALYALDCAPLWPTGRKPRATRISKPGPEALPPTALTRYEQLAGISFIQRTVTVRAMQGIFTVEDSYAQRLPSQMALRMRADAILRRPNAPQPLAVTAFIDLPDTLKPPTLYGIHFAWLAALKHLPLTLYAGGEMERRLRASFPNTLAYPDNSLLPRSLLDEGMTPTQFFRRNKLLLLQRTLRSYPAFSHVAWIDFDTLPHPVCPRAVPDCAPLMDQRAHIGWVNGEVDASFMVIPRNLIKLLTREVQAITQLDADMNRSFSEGELYRRLLERFPELFTLHPLPRRGLLFLRCFDPALLSAPLRQEIDTLAEPIQLPPSVADHKGRPSHDGTET